MFNVSARLHADAAAAPEQKSKITLRFFTPNAILYSDANPAAPPKHASNQVDLVLLPGSDGVLGVMPNHTPTVTQLQPGVVSIQESADKPVVKYFVSGGFAFVKSDSSVAITAVEAVPVEELDQAAVQAGVEKYRQEMERATDPLEKAKAQIAYETHASMNLALGGTIA